MTAVPTVLLSPAGRSGVILALSAAATARAFIFAASREPTPRFELVPGGRSVVGSTIATAEEVGADRAALDQLTRTISAKVSAGELPLLAVSVVKDGRQVLCAGAGEASAGVQLQPDSILRFYSMSKAVTTLTALLFLEEGKLALDDPISAHLSAWDDTAVTVIDTITPAHRPITVRDLICHTSGLTYGFRSDPEAAAIAKAYRTQRLELPHSITEHRDGFQVQPCASLREFAQRLNKIPLCAQPGSKFEYSVSTDLLGALLEELSGLDLQTLFRQRVFEPLKMWDTGFVIDKSKLHRLAACQRSLKVGKFEPALFGSNGSESVGSRGADTPYLAGGSQSRVCSGGGGLLSTLNDYTRFATCLSLGGELEGVVLLKPATLALAQRDHLSVIGAKRAGTMLSYQGFGLLGGVVTNAGVSGSYLPGGAAAGLGSFGWGGAAATYFFVDVENKLAVVLASQLLGYHIGAPTLRPEITFAVYKAFPKLRAKLNSDDSAVRRLSGFSG